jgi:hypothetical protein
MAAAAMSYILHWCMHMCDACAQVQWSAPLATLYHCSCYAYTFKLLLVKRYTLSSCCFRLGLEELLLQLVLLNAVRMIIWKVSRGRAWGVGAAS